MNDISWPAIRIHNDTPQCEIPSRSLDGKRLHESCRSHQGIYCLPAIMFLRGRKKTKKKKRMEVAEGLYVLCVRQDASLITRQMMVRRDKTELERGERLSIVLGATAVREGRRIRPVIFLISSWSISEQSLMQRKLQVLNIHLPFFRPMSQIYSSLALLLFLRHPVYLQAAFYVPPTMFLSASPVLDVTQYEQRCACTDAITYSRLRALDRPSLLPVLLQSPIP